MLIADAKTQFWVCFFYLFQALLVEDSGKFPKFSNMRVLLFGEIFLDEGYFDVKLELLGSFIQNAPGLEKLTLFCCMVQFCAILCYLPCLSYTLSSCLT